MELRWPCDCSLLFALINWPAVMGRTLCPLTHTQKHTSSPKLPLWYCLALSWMHFCYPTGKVVFFFFISLLLYSSTINFGVMSHTDCCSLHISLPWLFPYCALLITGILSPNIVSGFLEWMFYRKGPAILMSARDDRSACDCTDITYMPPFAGYNHQIDVHKGRKARFWNVVCSLNSL